MRTATREDLPALRALSARANDAPYDLERVADEKCFGDGVAGAPVTRVVERDGNIAGAAVTCGKYLRILIVDRSARRQGIGTVLLADSKARMIAAEAGNYFTPGVLDEHADFFRRRGYVDKATTWNLHVNLNTIEPVANVIRVSDRAKALDFIEREFGPIWRFEVSRAETIFITESNGEITGFATQEANNRGLGFFGPTGVARQHRGRGLGRALLLASLAELRRLGYARAIIPWTDAIEYYRKSCGAQPAHRFIGLDSAP